MVSGMAGLWNADRESVFGLISERSPDLAGLYRHGIMTLDSPPVAEGERARVAIIGHCFRELMNNLADAVGDVPAFVTSCRDDEDKAKRALVDLYAESYGIPDEAPPTGGQPEDDPAQLELVTVERRLLKAVERLAVFFKLGERHGRDRDSVVVAGRIDPNAPGLGPWREARRFFVRCSHYDRQYGTQRTNANLPRDDEILEHVLVVEAIVRTRLQPFFDTVAEIEDLLAVANAPEEEGGAL